MCPLGPRKAFTPLRTGVVESCRKKAHFHSSGLKTTVHAVHSCDFTVTKIHPARQGKDPTHLTKLWALNPL